MYFHLIVRVFENSLELNTLKEKEKVELSPEEKLRKSYVETRIDVNKYLTSIRGGVIAVGTNAFLSLRPPAQLSSAEPS
jgi:hypothetical protein